MRDLIDEKIAEYTELRLKAAGDTLTKNLTPEQKAVAEREFAIYCKVLGDLLEISVNIPRNNKQ